MWSCGKVLKFFILLILHHFTQGWLINFESFSQNFNPDIVKFMNLRLINITNHKNALNGSLMYRKDLDTFEVAFIVSSTKRNGKRWTLFNVTVDGCEYLEKSMIKNVKFPYMFLTELRTSNPDFPKQCPIEKDKEIFVRNFYINAEKISINFPELSFSALVILRHRGVQAFKIVFDGSVKTRI